MRSYDLYSIHADHMVIKDLLVPIFISNEPLQGMTKFSSPEDQGYVRILGELQRWKKKASRIFGSRPIPG